jgi:V/A-type H+-transporting ATPase subunit A
VDISVPRERQLESFRLLKDLIEREYDFKTKDQARDYFTHLTGAYKNLNYSAAKSPEYAKYQKEIMDLAAKNSLSKEKK